MMNAGLSWVGSANLGERRFHTGIELGEVEQIPQSLSAGALAVVGGVMASMSGKSVTWGAIRMLLAGGLAAAVTFGVGSLIGVSVSEIV